MASHHLLGRISFKQPAFLNLARVGLHLAQQIAEKFSCSKIQNMLDPIPESYSAFVESMKTSMDSTKQRSFNQMMYDLDGTSSTNSRIVENTAFRLLTDLVKFENDTCLPFINFSSLSKEKMFYIATAQGEKS